MHPIADRQIPERTSTAQGNGLPEAVVNTFKRHYVDGAELRDAETVLTPAQPLVRGPQHSDAALGARDAAPGAAMDIGCEGLRVRQPPVERLP